MSDSNRSDGSRSPLRVIEGGRSPALSSLAAQREKDDHQRLAELIRRGVQASGHGELGDELERAYLERQDADAKPTPAPLTPPPAPAPLAPSPQAAHKPRRGPRTRKPRRRPRREAHMQERQEALKTRFYGHADPSARDIPELRPETRAANLRVMQDGTGRKAIERMLTLPHGQAMALLAAGYAAAPKVRRGQSHRMTRREAGEASLPDELAELAEIAEIVREDVSASVWFRRLVSSAAAPWEHRAKLTAEARSAARGGVYVVMGFCQAALAWLVPKADGTTWSRSSLWREDGPFMTLGGAARGLGREVSGDPGLGLWTRWQPPARVAAFKGPARFNPITGKTEQFGLAQHRYDAAMSGRSTLSLARRARGRLREVARTVVAALAPWIELPEPRRRPVVNERGERVRVPSIAESALPSAPERGPP